MSFTVQVRTKNAKQVVRTTNNTNAQNTNAASSTPRLTITKNISNGNSTNGTNGTQRTIVTATRGKHIVRTASGMVIDSGAGASSSKFTISTSGGRHIISKKRRSGDITTFSRTITQDDMADTVDDVPVAESAPKRGRIQAPERIATSKPGGSFAITVPASSPQGFADVSFASSSPPTSSPFATPQLALPTPRPIFAAPSATTQASSRGKVAEAAIARVERQRASTTMNAPSATVPASVAVKPAAAKPAATPAPSPSSIIGTKVLLRNLSAGVNATFLLRHLFGAFDVPVICVDTDPVSHACSGTAEAIFRTRDEAEEAVTLCQGQQLLGQPVRLSIISENEISEDELKRQQASSQHTVRPGTTAIATPQLPPSASVKPLSQQKTFAPANRSANSAAAATAAASSSGPLLSAATSSSTPNGSPFTQPAMNVGFVWGDGDTPATVAGEETVFNITNLKLPQMRANTNAAASSSSSSASQSTLVQPVKKQLQIRPKSVVLSGAAATTAQQQPKRLNIVTKSARQEVVIAGDGGVEDMTR